MSRLPLIVIGSFLILFFDLSAELRAGDNAKAGTAAGFKPVGQLSPTEHWSKPYREFHELLVKIDEQVERNYWPEIMMIREGHLIASVQVDNFSVRVLREADEVLLPYRQGLQSCIDANHNEYRDSKVPSYEYFAWFLDNYIRTLVKALGNQEEPPRVGGVKERRVTTDRAVYAFTKLLMAYLEERTEKFRGLDNLHYAADKAVLVTLNDVARRVFRVDLTQKFDRREVVDKGMKSQPILRDLATNEGGADLSLGLDPLSHLMSESNAEPTCRVVLPNKTRQVSATLEK